MKAYSFILTSIGVIFLIGLSSCSKMNGCLEGNGPVVTKTLNINNFNGIDMAGADNVIISQGPEQEIVVKGHQNIIDRISTIVSSGVWQMKLANGCYNSYILEYYITVPDINQVTISGSGKVIVNDFENQSNLNLSISGSGNIDINSFNGANSLIADISGSGNIRCFEGFSDLNSINVTISGSGTLDAYPAITQNCSVNISGSGDCRLTVENQLDVSISGSGNVYYKGYPGISSNISGSGNVVNAN